MLSGFKQFIARGNVIDLAVGVIIGAAVSEIVTSLVKDIITPIIAIAGGRPDFSAIRLGAVGIGSFVNNVISFLVKAAGLYFLIVLPFNRFAARLAPPPTATERLLADILVELKANRSPSGTR